MVSSLVKAGLTAGICFLLSTCTNQGPVQVNSEAQLQNISASLSKSTVLDFSYCIRAKPCIVQSPRYANSLELVVRFSDGETIHEVWSPGMPEWKLYATISGIQSDPSLCVNRVDNTLQMVAIDVNNTGNLHHYWLSGGTWVSAETYGSNLTGAPALLCNNQNNNLEVIARDNTGKYMHLYRDQSYNWHVTEYLPMLSQQVAYGDPSFAQTPNGNFHVVANTRDLQTGVYSRNYWTRTFVNGKYTWSIRGCESNVAANTAPSIIAMNDGRIEVFYKQATGQYSDGIVCLTVASASSTRLIWDDYIADEPGHILNNVCATVVNGNQMYLHFDHEAHGPNFFTDYHGELWKLMR